MVRRWKKFESGVIQNVKGFELEGNGEEGTMEIQECEVVIRGYIKKRVSGLRTSR